MAARLFPGKGIEEFLDLAARIHELAPYVRFCVAGDGPMRSEYERQALRHGLGSAISFCGFVKDIGSFWRDVDIAAFMGSSEAFGLGLIEPIVQGVPVIAYRNGSGSDEVIDRCRGIVATTYGQVDELAKVAVALTRSENERKQLALAGREDVRCFFSLEKMEVAIRETYRSVSLVAA
jgi:glycosyltransferase involved in cell wall biosynthesis